MHADVSDLLQEGAGAVRPSMLGDAVHRPLPLPLHPGLAGVSASSSLPKFTVVGLLDAL